jgi:hypothetical protein
MVFFVAYYWVSTDRQDADARRSAVVIETRLNGGHHELIGQFNEVESQKQWPPMPLRSACPMSKSAKRQSS